MSKTVSQYCSTTAAKAGGGERFGIGFKRRKRSHLGLVVAVGLFALSGANCPRAGNPFARTPELPPQLTAAPSLDQVIQVVNRNNGQVESFSTNTASLSSPGVSPTLRANIVFQRARRLRLRADFMSSPELDLGSNDEGFWFWVKRNQPPAVFWCRHDQYAQSAARQMIPISPEWFVDAMGLAMLDPSLPHQGPIQLDDKRIEIDTIRETPEGPQRKATIVDARQGWILEQRLHDAQGRLLASSTTSGHQQDYATGLWMARYVQIVCPQPGQPDFVLKLDLGQMRVNQVIGDPAALWSVPSYPQTPIVDIGRPDFRLPVVPPPGGGTQPMAPPYARQVRQTPTPWAPSR